MARAIFHFVRVQAPKTANAVAPSDPVSVSLPLAFEMVPLQPRLSFVPCSIM